MVICGDLSLVWQRLEFQPSCRMSVAESVANSPNDSPTSNKTRKVPGANFLRLCGILLDGQLETSDLF